MARASRRSKLKVPDSGGRPAVPPPWLEMDPDDEQAARAIYAALRARAGGPPVAGQHDRSSDMIGAAPVSLWWAARFDSDKAFRRLALVAAVDHVRRQVVKTIHWIAQTNAPPDDGPLEGLAGQGVNDRSVCDYAERARMTNPLAGLSEDGGDATGARKVLAELAADVLPLGLYVTEGGVNRPTRGAGSMNPGDTVAFNIPDFAMTDERTP